MNAVPRTLRLGFAGTPQFAIPALDALATSRHGVAAVFTQPDRPAGRGQSMHSSAVKQRARELGVAVYQPQNFKTPDAIDHLRNLHLDALVVVAYGLILPTAALEAPELGCFNIHASLLPRWRGAAPIQRALLAGDVTTGVTIMRMEAGLDTGPMLASRPMAVAPRETAGSLHDRLAKLGGELIVESLETIADGTARPQPQSDVGITYAAKIGKAEALIDWNQDAVDVVRRVRAFNPWPIAETRLRGKQLRLWEVELWAAVPTPALAAAPGKFAAAISQAAHTSLVDAAPGTVVGVSNDGVDVACGRGTLRILRMQLAGRKPLGAREFIQSQELVGARFSIT